MTDTELERILEDQLENKTLEEIFELFNLTPLDIFQLAYYEGHLDDEILQNLLPL